MLLGQTVHLFSNVCLYSYLLVRMFCFRVRNRNTVRHTCIFYDRPRPIHGTTQTYVQFSEFSQWHGTIV